MPIDRVDAVTGLARLFPQLIRPQLAPFVVHEVPLPSMHRIKP